MALQQFANEVELTWSITGDPERTVMPVMTIPEQLPKICSGSYATVIGLIENPKKLNISGTVTLKFNVKGQTYTISAHVPEAKMPRQEKSGESSLPFHMEAAMMQILELSDKHASLDTTKEDQLEEAARIQKKIVALSTSANVISRFTAFVGVDPEKSGEFRPP
ncbi:unnamed protein product [Dibothriocephalus latus]|uniref:Uncharacterized protein n=1 Tax=Dibothriocephalus latus TaxID=60516 RepID=A0A3P7N1I9_DIBLA|nr:unnamed protein product [Dibothriocephalus latus]